MPADPRQAAGRCAALGVTGTQFDGTYLPWQTGGAGAGTIVPSASAPYAQWPPATINGLEAPAAASLLPTYTSTGTVATLPPPTFTASVTINPGNGWFDAADTASGVTTVQGCSYPNAWAAEDIAIPAACGATAAAAAAAAPVATVTTAPKARR
jgi:hypothetical protein